jgi:hypothetical protein
MGTQAAATGEDPSCETASAEPSSSREDPGTTHPAKADMGEKYASLLDTGNQIQAGLAVSAQMMASLPAPGAAEKTASKKCDKCGEMYAEGAKCGCPPAEKSAAAAPAAAPEGTPAEKTAGVEEAEAAGRQAAAALDQSTKEAAAQAEQMPSREEVVGSLIKAAKTDAHNVRDYLEGFMSEKSAAELAAAGVPPEALAAAAGPEAGGIPPEMAGAMPPEAAGAMPPEMAGGMPPEAAPGPEAGGGGEMAAILAALEQAGITPEQLIAMLEGAGGAAPAAPEAPPAEPPAEPPPAEPPTAEPPSGGDEGGGDGGGASAPPEKSEPEEEKEAAMAQLKAVGANFDTLPREQKTAALVGALRTLVGSAKDVPVPAAS